MFKLLVRVIFGLLVINLAITSCEGFRRTSKYQSRREEKAQPQTSARAAAALPNQSPRRGLGISAWGLVTLIVSLILAVAGLYYFSICYPIICQKNRKYDMIGLTSVA